MRSVPMKLSHNLHGLGEGAITGKSRLAAGMGMASVIHRVAINTATAALAVAAGIMSAGWGESNTSANKTGPNISPRVRRVPSVLAAVIADASLW